MIMRKHCKALAAILALFLAASALTACGGGETAEKTAAEETAVQETQAAETEETRYVADYLPNVTYDGYQYRIISYDEYPAHVEELTGEVIDDAIFERNALVEETYNIEFMQELYPFTEYDKVTALMTNAGRAQSDDFDLATLVFRAAYYAVLEGTAPAASSLPIADLSQPWYVRSVNEGLNIDGVTLLGFTAFDLNPGGKCLLFNRNLLTDLNLEDPYDLVDEGSWTCDVLYSMAESAISDLNGDGQMTVDDRFSFITEWDWMSMIAYIGTGNLLVDVIDGVPVASQSEALIDAFTKVVQYLNIDGFMLDTFKEFGTAEASRIRGLELFKEGHSLFVCTGTTNLTIMGDMEADYGLVPFPKWTAEQARYYSYLDRDAVALPLSCSTDLERVCVIKEALAVESLNINHPAYYENALKNRYLRDERSLAMLEIITNTVVNDLGQNPWWDIVRTPWQDTMSKKGTEFASAVQKNMPKSEKAIADLMEMVESLKG
ncbi:MAG: hypothetical protein E7631_02600 [Ruminococcaceae bacterium]|nr:hypothetical protein [Oscillospiraceae bacterium]